MTQEGLKRLVLDAAQRRRLGLVARFAVSSDEYMSAYVIYGLYASAKRRTSM